MQKGIKTRYIAHEILFNLKNNNYNFDEILNSNYIKHNLSISDRKMVHSIVLSSMRFSIHVGKIIPQYIKTKQKPQHWILFLSAITQIVYLNFKEYAVVNSTVELSKNKKINMYPGFVNAVLKQIIKDKSKLQKIKIQFKELPYWFLKEFKGFSTEEKVGFINSITKKPNLHLVFKNTITKSFDKINSIKTSKKSLVILENLPIKKLPGYVEGEWWVQDYSAMLPLYLTKNLHNKNVIDLCSAPGGKSLQALSSGAILDLIEINPKRANLLQSNLTRLNYKNKVTIEDALKISNFKKYDYVIVDSPCSSVGTIRRNPEIFFRKSKPNLEAFSIKQEKLLNKAKEILKKNGIIIYMVCSFLPIETTIQIKKFLKKNKNFSIEKFIFNSSNKNIVDSNGYIKIVPKYFKKFNIDGFFAVKLIKND